MERELAGRAMPAGERARIIPLAAPFDLDA